jgi:hypothetical protein
MISAADEGQVSATERDEGSRMGFDIEAKWPGNHRPVAYSGTLDLASQGERP